MYIYINKQKFREMLTITQAVISTRQTVQATTAFKESSKIQQMMLKNRASIVAINEAMGTIDRIGWNSWKEKTNMNGRRMAVVQELTSN